MPVSPGSVTTDEEDGTDVEDITSRGRSYGQNKITARPSRFSRNGSEGLHPIDSRHSRDGSIRRSSFTRSRSPMPPAESMNAADIPRTSSPSWASRNRRTSDMYLLPPSLDLSFRLPFSAKLWTISMDARKAGECFLLAASLAYVTQKLSSEQFTSAPDIQVSTGSHPCTFWCCNFSFTLPSQNSSF